MNAAFTPGPWGIATCPRNGDLAIVTPHMNANDGEPAIVAECFEDIRQANEHAKDECNANARLIAAAPDLYAALQDAAKVINGMHMGTLPPCFKPTLELVNAINYALSRAAS